MKSLNGLEKSKGIVLFTFNTKEINYTKITEQSIRIIKKVLNLPITIITDEQTEINFDVNVIRIPPIAFKNARYSHSLKIVTEWKNLNRCLALELSPYDETILMDVDFLVFDTFLLKLFDLNFDYLLFQKNKYLDSNNLSVMGPTSLPYVWATVCLFRKTEKTKRFFQLAKMIQRNYQYYCKLYNIKDRNYRNDFTFSIANYMLNGYTINSNTYIPTTMQSFAYPINSLKIVDNNIVAKNATKSFVIPMHNLHVHDKIYLLSDNFKEFVNQYEAI